VPSNRSALVPSICSSIHFSPLFPLSPCVFPARWKIRELPHLAASLDVTLRPRSAATCSLEVELGRAVTSCGAWSGGFFFLDFLLLLFLTLWSVFGLTSRNSIFTHLPPRHFFLRADGVRFRVRRGRVLFFCFRRTSRHWLARCLFFHGFRGMNSGWDPVYSDCIFAVYADSEFFF